MEIFDSHCHLFLPEYHDLPQVDIRARAAGVANVLNVGLDDITSQEALELAQSYQGYYASAGWHPHEAKNLGPKGLGRLLELCQEQKVIAFGEIGLDFFRLHSPKETQLKAFQDLLGAASKSGLPVIIHSRDAFQDTYRMLSAFKDSLSGILIHCFGGSMEEAQAYLSLGACLSFPGVISFPKNQELRRVAAEVPEDRILIETDGPYLAPVPHRGGRNEPAYLVHHLEHLAQARGISPERSAALTCRNAKRFFGLA
jgi:TatD DNase family protein